MTTGTPSELPKEDTFESIGEAARGVFLMLALATMKFADDAKPVTPASEDSGDTRAEA